MPDTNKNGRVKLNALSFFSGAMGLDLGLERAGIETVLASEIDEPSINTIKKNKPNIPVIGDIRNYNAEEIKDEAGIIGDVDFVVGGPPCQAFSTAGKRRGFNDERGNVFLKFIDVITELRPKYALIENVRGLLSAALQHRPHEKRGKDHPKLTIEEKKGGALLHILKKLESAGYGYSFNLYNSANYGSPQKRERVIIICSRDGDVLPFIPPTHSEDGKRGLKTWRTFRDAVQDLSIPEDEHDHVNFSDKRLKYYKMLGPGEYWRDLPEDVQKEAMGRSYNSGGGRTGFYRRLAWDEPSPTLVTSPAMAATSLAHPEKDRPLSVKEYKRIQEFPDEYEITGNIRDQYKQIGNAVPLSLGEAAGKLILSHYQNKEIEVIKNFRYSRYRNTDHIRWKEKLSKEFQQLDLGLKQAM